MALKFQISVDYDMLQYFIYVLRYSVRYRHIISDRIADMADIDDQYLPILKIIG